MKPRQRDVCVHYLQDRDAGEVLTDSPWDSREEKQL